MKKLHPGVLTGVLTSVLILLTFLLATQAGAHPTYIGYSGAPGSSGQCAASCHGVSGGTIQVSGFPTTYTAGQAYTITITHVGGSMIKQFNGSCRVGTTSQNAGVITAGTNTVTYNTAVETNGIHMSGLDLMSGTFTWTAPSAGTGTVKLYIAGHQGTVDGPNTELVFIAQEQTADVGDAAPADTQLTYATPNPFSAQTVIWYAVPRAAPGLLEIFDASGRRLEAQSLDESIGLHQITWNASMHPSGVYFYRIQTGSYSEIKKILLSK